MLFFLAVPHCLSLSSFPPLPPPTSQTDTLCFFIWWFPLGRLPRGFLYITLLLSFVGWVGCCLLAPKITSVKAEQIGLWIPPPHTLGLSVTHVTMEIASGLSEGWTSDCRWAQTLNSMTHSHILTVFGSQVYHIINSSYILHVDYQFKTWWTNNITSFKLILRSRHKMPAFYT